MRIKKSKARIDLVGYINLLDVEISMFRDDISHFKDSNRWRECIIYREHKKATQNILKRIDGQEYAKKNTASRQDVEDLIIEEMKYEKAIGSDGKTRDKYEDCMSSLYRLEQYEYLIFALERFEKKK